MTITEEELKRLEGLCEGMTKEGDIITDDMLNGLTIEGCRSCYEVNHEKTRDRMSKASEYARKAVRFFEDEAPDILSTIRELREENERLRSGIEWVKNNSGAHYSDINAAACTALGERHDHS